MTPQATVIIAVYNNVRALRLIMDALARQTFTAFEVIIADDGSGRHMADAVNAAKRTMPFPIRHLWHADKGWRKNTMLNDAIRESRSEYLIFFDGDCIPSSRFVEDHYAYREKGKVLLGRRVEHGQRWAEELDGEKVSSGEYERYSAQDLWDAAAGRSTRLEHGVRIGSDWIRSFVEKSGDMLGCNFSTYREHLLQVNGFDEEYDGPGFGEDTDLFFRLQLMGVRGKSLRNLAIQYHLWHPQTVVPSRNRERFERTVQRKDSWCRRGLARD